MSIDIIREEKALAVCNWGDLQIQKRFPDINKYDGYFSKKIDYQRFFDFSFTYDIFDCFIPSNDVIDIDNCFSSGCFSSGFDVIFSKIEDHIKHLKLVSLKLFCNDKPRLKIYIGNYHKQTDSDGFCFFVHVSSNYDYIISNNEERIIFTDEEWV